MRCTPPEVQVDAIGRALQLNQLGLQVSSCIVDRIANARIDFDIALHQLGLVRHRFPVTGELAQQVLDATRERLGIPIDEAKFQFDADGRLII